MILLDEITELTVAETGNILLPIDSFGFTDIELTKIFRDAVGRVQAYRPSIEFTQIQIPSTGYQFTGRVPKNIFRILPVSVTNPAFHNRIKPLSNADWTYSAGLLYVVYAGLYTVEAYYPYTIEQQTQSYTAMNLLGNETTATFELRGKFTPTSLTISDSAGTLSVDDGAGAIAGALCTGTITGTKTRDVALVFPGVPAAGALTVSYQTQNVGVVELDSSDDFFIKVFKAMLMIGLGNAKKITRLDSLPVDLSSDDLSSTGQTMLEAALEELSTSKSKWWLF